MAKVNFSTNMKAGGGVNLGKKAKVKADVQIAGEETVGMDYPEHNDNIVDQNVIDQRENK